MNVLVACSDEIILRLLVCALSDHGTYVCAVRHPDDIAKMCAETKYSVIITDFEHWLSNGRNIVGDLRSGFSVSAQVYLVSWSQHEQTVLGRYESGVNQYFALPLNIDRLVRKVKCLNERVAV